MPILIYIYICMPDSLLGTSTSIENAVKRNTRRNWPDGWDGLRVGGQRLDFEGIICYLIIMGNQNGKVEELCPAVTTSGPGAVGLTSVARCLISGLTLSHKCLDWA